MLMPERETTWEEEVVKVQTAFENALLEFARLLESQLENPRDIRDFRLSTNAVIRSLFAKTWPTLYYESPSIPYEVKKRIFRGRRRND